MKLYLAGPDVFLSNALGVGHQKRVMCQARGFEGLYPLDNKLPEGEAAIFAANQGLMDKADAGLFNLSPFRGPSADAGTVFELGYMAAKGKKVFGYSNDGASYAARAVCSHGPTVEEEGVLRDRNGHMIERFGLTDNLMITEAVRSSGGFCLAKAEAGEPKLAAFSAFNACLAKIRGE